MSNKQVFQQVNYTLSGLVDQISMGNIGLPDIQRPFVWKNIKVRDLFDSMYRGYPVGYLLFWQNAQSDGAYAIGTNSTQLAPSLLIVDGQQRLTSLYAVIKNIAVLRENYKSEHIKISFNPLEEKFEVADAAIERNKFYIPDISIIWKQQANLFEVVENYLANITTTTEITLSDKQKIQNSFIKLQGLLHFPFTALVLSASVDEEVVADVFVRINSKGTPLNQADFILTLMSVFADEERTKLEKFCNEARQPSEGKATAFNQVFQPDPDQLLRVSVGVGFKRARLRTIYSLLRGKDLETEIFSDSIRETQFKILKEAQKSTLELTNWHSFLECVRSSGFLHSKMITSQSSLLFSYILYLIGKINYKIEPEQLKKVISKWFFMSSLTGRFTNSPESSMEFDLARLRDAHNADTFLAILNTACEQALTEDFWKITLPNDLATSSSRSPSLSAYHASLILLNATALFSKNKIADLLNPNKWNNGPLADRLHLFSRDFLHKQQITDLREVNQIANYSLVDWSDKELRSKFGKSPDYYLPTLKQTFSDIELQTMYIKHALPDNWESMPYKDFLEVRRKKMAAIIRRAYLHLDGQLWDDDEEASIESRPVAELVALGESDTLEFKSTLAINLFTQKYDFTMELMCLKTVAAFLNSQGGTLLIGVKDNGRAEGLQPDLHEKFKTEDAMGLYLNDLLHHNIRGVVVAACIRHYFADYEGKRLLVVECRKSHKPVYVKDIKSADNEIFYVRQGASTKALTGNEALQYIQYKFPLF